MDLSRLVRVNPRTLLSAALPGPVRRALAVVSGNLDRSALDVARRFPVTYPEALSALVEARNHVEDEGRAVALVEGHLRARLRGGLSVLDLAAYLERRRARVEAVQRLPPGGLRGYLSHNATVDLILERQKRLHVVLKGEEARSGASGSSSGRRPVKGLSRAARRVGRRGGRGGTR